MDLNPSGGSAGQSKRVFKFKPKPPPKREIVLPKAEKDENDIDEAKAEHLRRRFQETSSKLKAKPERKAAPVEVAFGVGGSSRTLKSYGSAKHLLKNGALSSEEAQRVGKEYKEPWDYYSNYPSVLPFRSPYAGDPAILDREEFGDDPVNSNYVKNDTPVAEELGLLEEDSKDNMFFLYLPPMLPTRAQPADSEVPELENKPNQTKGPGKNSLKFCNLDSLPEGMMGKMLVYKSGAVKLKIGDTLFDVSTGVKCSFARDAAAINVEKKQFFNLGEISKQAIVTPSMSGLIESLSQI